MVEGPGWCPREISAGGGAKYFFGAREVVSPPGDMFWGDRHAELQDKYGLRWSLVSELPEDRKAAVASQARVCGAKS